MSIIHQLHVMNQLSGIAGQKSCGYHGFKNALLSLMHLEGVIGTEKFKKLLLDKELFEAIFKATQPLLQPSSSEQGISLPECELLLSLFKRGDFDFSNHGISRSDLMNLNLDLRVNGNVGVISIGSTLDIMLGCDQGHLIEVDAWGNYIHNKKNLSDITRRIETSFAFMKISDWLSCPNEEEQVCVKQLYNLTKFILSNLPSNKLEIDLVAEQKLQPIFKILGEALFKIKSDAVYPLDIIQQKNIRHEAKIINELKTKPVIADLFNKIRAMLFFGETLSKSGSGKGIVVVNHANTLNNKLSNFLLTSSEEKPTIIQINAFKADFIRTLNYANTAMQAHRKIWNPIIANILIALTGIGFIAIVVKVAVDAIKHGKQMSINGSLFFATTNSEKQAKTVKDSFELFALSC